MPRASKMSREHAFAVHLSRVGAAISARRFRQTGQPILADTNAEISRALLGEIRQRYPGCQVIDDVSCRAEQLQSGQPTWVVDYLDGEKNFEIGFPYFACSVALYRGGVCQVAAVTDGLHSDTFSYALKKGSFYGRQRLDAPSHLEPRRSVISVSWASLAHDNIRELNTLLYERILPIFPQQRRAGSIALDLCYIATGRFGGIYAYNPLLVDLAAGLPIARGAGCEAVNFRGELFEYGMEEMVVAPPSIMEVLLPHIVSLTIPFTRTSLSHPFCVDFIPETLLETPGKLGLSFAPGKKDGGSLFAWERDLAQDLDVLADSIGVKVVVSFLEDHEYELIRIPSFFEEAGRRNIRVHRFPIQDRGVPDDKGALLALIETVDGLIAAGGNVMMHCRGGIGRTGLVAACLLVYRGFSAERAIAIVKDTRVGALDQENQMTFVRDFEAWVRRRP